MNVTPPDFQLNKTKSKIIVKAPNESTYTNIKRLTVPSDINEYNQRKSKALYLSIFSCLALTLQTNLADSVAD